MKNICGIRESGSFLLSGFQPFEKGGWQQPKAARTFSPLAVGLTADGAFSPSCPYRAGRQLNAMQTLAVGLTADGNWERWQQAGDCSSFCHCRDLMG